MLRILYDDFDQKVKNIHDEMNSHHSYIKKQLCIVLVNKYEDVKVNLVALAS